ncbi:MAG: hypothetical protein K0R70_204 [Steroidobacteraceae bacterium]|jgi:hypothetical protein|nr:hypothetical protein [Steroidobacteraceae bacterium]
MNQGKLPPLAGTARAVDERAVPAPGVAPVPPVATSSATPAPPRPVSAQDANARRSPSKFGAAADGWDAYNSWLGRVRQPTPPSRQAVIAKALYSVSSYKTWADKARGAFDPGAPGGNATPNGKVK